MYALHCARRFRSSIDPKETLKFSKLSHDWWNPVGTSRFLHAMNPCRLEFITAKVPLDYHPVTIMDIGCGAGILTEPLARRFNGSHVIGIDSVIESIDVAIKHAKLDPNLSSDIDTHRLEYLHTSAERYLENTRESVDMITMLELLEHVPDPGELLRVAYKLMKPGGYIFLSTISRTVLSYGLAILGAENIARVVPEGTHDWNKFITPMELSSMANNAGFRVLEYSGMVYNPIFGTWHLVPERTSINYIMVLAIPNTDTDADTNIDSISSVKFDSSGKFLSIGDCGGRVTIFRMEINPKGNIRYKPLSTFQSHTPQFDSLKSIEIQEKINMIQFPFPTTVSTRNFLLTTNDKTIKLWKSQQRRLDRTPIVSSASEQVAVTKCVRVYDNGHTYHVNSISCNSDYETFLSSDDLRINMWSLERESAAFNIVDIKPDSMEDLTEVITSACFHPTHCNIVMYSTSRGAVRLVDMRDNAIGDKYAKNFYVDQDAADKSFYSEIIASASDSKWLQRGDAFIVRDYMTLKIWDVRRESGPVDSIPIHPALAPRLCEVYSNDSIFDKFECATGGVGGTVAITGSYDGNFTLYDGSTKGGTVLNCFTGAVVPDPVSEYIYDYTRKTLCCDVHPTKDIIAVASVENLYIFCRQPRCPKIPHE